MYEAKLCHGLSLINLGLLSAANMGLIGSLFMKCDVPLRPLAWMSHFP